ncbi:MAG TPA: GTPase HflX, partial [bacterium]|nr:GTPase HflX [bacterium]
MKRIQTGQFEKALLLAAFPPSVDRISAQYEAEELKNLAATAGAHVVEVCEQHLKSIHPATFIGKGKLQEIKDRLAANDLDIILFSQDLSPIQQRNLERELNRRIVDRTELILDIFAQHAQSKDGMIQVELAQLRYLRPRLTGRGVMLSRLGGGIGTRGPGETKLEVDRRRIDHRIAR